MTTQKYPDNCLIATYDARDVAAAAGLVRDTLDRFGQLDVLVNNAGRADGLQEGDPVRATEIIVSLAHSDEVPLRLPLGREAVERSAGDNRAADTFADCRLPRQRATVGLVPPGSPGRVRRGTLRPLLGSDPVKDIRRRGCRMPRRVKVEGDRYHGRVPKAAVYVGRAAPGLKASPYSSPHAVGRRGCRVCGGRVHERGEVIELYRLHLREHPELVEQARRELAGKDLACWCPLDQACHADVLLAVAGGKEP